MGISLYSYNSKWDENEECLQMRDGQGDEMHILFTDNGCAINGFAHEFLQQDKALLTDGLPAVFSEFIFGEPVASIGTTFCLWTTGSNGWQTGVIENHENNSEEMLTIFDGNPQTYINWAEEYFEGSYKESGIPLETVVKIYNGALLTREMVLSVIDDVDDWNQLIANLDEINYPHTITAESAKVEKKPKWKFW